MQQAPLVRPPTSWNEILDRATPSDPLCWHWLVAALAERCAAVGRSLPPELAGTYYPSVGAMSAYRNTVVSLLSTYIELDRQYDPLTGCGFEYGAGAWSFFPKPIYNPRQVYWYFHRSNYQDTLAQYYRANPLTINNAQSLFVPSKLKPEYVRRTDEDPFFAAEPDYRTFVAGALFWLERMRYVNGDPYASTKRRVFVNKETDDEGNETFFQRATTFQGLLALFSSTYAPERISSGLKIRADFEHGRSSFTSYAQWVKDGEPVIYVTDDNVNVEYQTYRMEPYDRPKIIHFAVEGSVHFNDSFGTILYASNPSVLPARAFVVFGKQDGAPTRKTLVYTPSGFEYPRFADYYPTHTKLSEVWEFNCGDGWLSNYERIMEQTFTKQTGEFSIVRDEYTGKVYSLDGRTSVTLSGTPWQWRNRAIKYPFDYGHPQESGSAPYTSISTESYCSVETSEFDSFGLGGSAPGIGEAAVDVSPHGESLLIDFDVSDLAVGSHTFLSIQEDSWNATATLSMSAHVVLDYYDSFFYTETNLADDEEGDEEEQTP